MDLVDLGQVALLYTYYVVYAAAPLVSRVSYPTFVLSRFVSRDKRAS